MLLCEGPAVEARIRISLSSGRNVVLRWSREAEEILETVQAHIE
jgi:hypothetical protein